ncbi:MAG: hypothetical protein HFK06_05805 [Clostridia bacterium]|nr:hypothetical protein [Clostridia bacterium]
MAEERLIDDDKDRKYRIRVNENGEEELEIIDPDDVDEEPVFDMPDYEEDDEEAAILTPEQLAERERIKAEEERARAEKLSAFLDSAKEKLFEGDYEGANYAVTQAEEYGKTSGELFCLKLKVLTRDLTEFLNLEECAEAADGVKEYADETLKEEFRGKTGKLEALISDAEAKTEALREKNEAGKDERRETFASSKKRAFIALLCTLVPFTALLIVTLVFTTFMFADANGVYLVATIVLAALSVIMFIATVVTSKKFWSAARDVKLNEKDTSTKLGREYLENKTQYELLKRIYSAFEL